MTNFYKVIRMISSRICCCFVVSISLYCSELVCDEKQSVSVFARGNWCLDDADALNPTPVLISVYNLRLLTLKSFHV